MSDYNENYENDSENDNVEYNEEPEVEMEEEDDENASELSDAIQRNQGAQILTDDNQAEIQVERITPNFLTKYEKARVIGTRALQISKNSPVLVDLGKDDYDPIMIAERELAEKKIPFVIRRFLPDGSYEDWKLSELEILDRFQLTNIYLTMLLIYIFLFRKFLGGKIYPSDKHAIYNTISNSGQYADYTFNFFTESGIDINDTIHIIFPSQFTNNLSDLLITCDQECFINEREVIFKSSKKVKPFDQVTLTVFKVMNPNEQGGVANFYIRVFSGGFLKDQNLRYGILGISQQIKQLSSANVSIDQKGVNKSGMQNKLIFEFKTSDQIPSNIYIRLYFPKNVFKINNLPPCQSDYSKGNLIKGVLSCQKVVQNEWDVVDVYGIEGELKPLSFYQISILISNPTYEMITDNFGIAIIKNGTNVIFQNDMNIKGIEIVPANINNIQFYSIEEQLLVTRNKEMRFRLSFNLTNYLNEQNIIKITIPVSIKVLDFVINEKSSNFHVQRGLQRKLNEQITFELDTETNQLIIYNFEPKYDNEIISILFYLKTPDNEGLSSPLLIQTLTQKEMGYVIDQDNQFATFYVHNIKSPQIFSVQLSSNFIKQTKEIIQQVVFSTIWTQTIPQKGYIKITLPQEIETIEVTSQNCLIQNSDDPTDLIESSVCFKVDNTINVQIKSQFFKDKERSIIIQNCILNPIKAGKYLIDITSYIEDAESPIESYQQSVDFISHELLDPMFEILSNEAQQKGLVSIYFKLPTSIVDSQLPHPFTIPYSFIDIQIETSETFFVSQDYNTGIPNGSEIPCNSFKDLLSDVQIKCTFMTNNIPTVRVENYKELQQGQEVVILIPNFENSLGDVKFTVRIIENREDQYEEKCHYTQTIQIQNQISPSLQIDFSQQQDFYIVQNDVIGQDNMIQFNLSFEDRVFNKDYILIEMPYYQEGFCQKQDIKCYIQEQRFDCVCISDIDWILIQLSEFDEFAPFEVQLKIEGITNPKSVSQEDLNFQSRVIDFNGSTKKMYLYPIFQKLNPKSFDKITFIPEIQKQKPDSIYTLIINSNIDLPQDTVAFIEFPYMYDLTQSNPPIRVEIYIDNIQISGFNFRIATNKITIEKLQQIKINQNIKIQMKGINNPNYDGQIQNFNFQILNSQYFLITENKDFSKFFLSLPYDIKNVELKQVQAFPLNASINSDHIFNIKLISSLLQGTNIIIVFPDGFKNLPSEPQCIIQGAINSFEKCERSFQEIQLTLDKDYIYKDHESDLEIKVLNVRNSDMGNQKYFQTQIRYSDKLLYQTNQLQNHQIDIVQKPQEIEILDYEFTPQNEAEINTLIITFLPYNPIDIQTEIVLIFPQIFDNDVGDDLTITLELFQKNKLDYKKEDRKIIAYGLFNYTPNRKSPLKLTIIGIVNPNQYTFIFQDKDYFIEMGLKQKQNNFYTDYSENILKLDVQRAPGQLTIHDIQFSNQFCRLQSNLKFNVTFNQALPKEEVESYFIIDFPKQFDNKDGEIKAKSYSTNWQNLKSKFVSNKLYSTGNMEDYRGNFVGKIFGIQNPLDQTILGAFNVKTYDQTNKKIIERSFENINPFNYQYIYPGPLIVINNDQEIVLYKGTQSETIEIYIENQAALNLTLVPNNKKITYYPYPININIGEKYKYIQISVPQDFESGEYFIDWTLQGEKYPKIYTPIKQSLITIKNKSNLQISLQKHDYIPFTGYSLPYKFELEYAPDIQLEIIVNFKKDYEGLKLSKNILTFNPNKKVDSFYIYFNKVKDSKKVIEQGSINLKLQGINKDIYNLEYEELNFVIDAIDNQKGQIWNFNIIDFDKNWVQFQFSANKVGVVYYLIALKGTQKPQIDHLKKQKLQYNVVYKQFGTIYIYETDLQQKIFKIQDLLPSYEYIIYYFFENLTGISNQEPYQYEFKTKERYKTAEISLRLDQTYVYYEEELEILKHIALVLSLPQNKVVQKQVQINSFVDDGRRLQSNILQESMKIFFTFNILPVPENPHYPSPKILGDSLNQKIDMLKSRIQQLDSGYRIQSSEFQSVLPKFVLNPKIIDYDYQKVILEFQFDNIGWIYGVAIQNSNLELSKDLTPFQIFLGLDYFNQQTPSSKLNVLRTYQNIDLIINNLKPLTYYEILLIVADSDPGYQKLQDQKEIKRFQITTLEAPEQDFLYLTNKIIKNFIIVILALSFIQIYQVKLNNINHQQTNQILNDNQ